MVDTAPVIIWFRRDLRLADNPALAAAVETGAPVIPLYLLDESPVVRPFGGAHQWWLDKSLGALAAACRALGSPLVLRRGPAEQLIPELARELGARGVYWNRLYDPGLPARDDALQSALEDAGVEALTFNASLLIEPGALKTKTGGVYAVFTPFWRAARSAIHVPDALPAPKRLRPPAEAIVSDDLEAWRLHPARPDWSTGFDWTPGEAAGRDRLHAFVQGALGGYSRGRDAPAEDGSSRLSTYLHWGEVGPGQIWRCVHEAAASRRVDENEADKLLAELAWREFNHHLLAQHPDLATRPIKRPFDRMPWRRAPGDLSTWTAGRTGYPVVDAGMRQLWRTGWMHNRVRLITASFLVKHLLIDWREGERWFWDTLVDADEANNAANWQWIAGSGVDASPFFRIFNPVLQGEKFDREGDYVRRWVPELSQLPAKVIHQPWRADADLLGRAGVKLGRSYPRPMVDHAAARARALDALRGVGDAGVQAA